MFHDAALRSVSTASVPVIIVDVEPTTEGTAVEVSADEPTTVISVQEANNLQRLLLMRPKLAVYRSER